MRGRLQADPFAGLGERDAQLRGAGGGQPFPLALPHMVEAPRPDVQPFGEVGELAVGGVERLGRLRLHRQAFVEEQLGALEQRLRVPGGATIAGTGESPAAGVQPQRLALAAVIAVVALGGGGQCDALAGQRLAEGGAAFLLEESGRAPSAIRLRIAAGDTLPAVTTTAST